MRPATRCSYYSVATGLWAALLPQVGSPKVKRQGRGRVYDFHSRWDCWPVAHRRLAGLSAEEALIWRGFWSYPAVWLLRNVAVLSNLHA